MKLIAGISVNKTFLHKRTSHKNFSVLSAAFEIKENRFSSHVAATRKRFAFRNDKQTFALYNVV